MSQAFLGATHLPLDVWHVKTTNILEFDALEQIPDTFLGIEGGEHSQAGVRDGCVWLRLWSKSL
ncbi:hypothetical protein KSC_001200 [Ktedonobacter sp. SOSP1-52]|uniref:hypothetical protein n=1 Tax=Ktedonobacter sp. SOSP1-52 TaxID=2778366 RepID=UPI0019156688|nr:hypothetical protein [Ktedonobacter sp. SOSP1-52]GHO61228.1 hypothetical protein KSC_001200 [Ktedonobacter sp. SOSP1-52]